MGKMKFGFLASFREAPIVGLDVAPISSPAAMRFSLTLRAKGIVAFATLVAYLAIIGLYVAYERQRLLYMVQQLEGAHAEQESLVRTNTGLIHSIVVLQDLLNSGIIDPPYDDIQLDLASFVPSLPELKVNYPETAQNIGRFERRSAELNTGRSREKLIALRDSEQQLAAQLVKIESVVQERGNLLGRDYRTLNHKITLFWWATSLLGVLAFGAVVTLFFSRLAADIKKLEARAMAVVGGYRGAPLDVGRRDEVGGLIRAVNGMQSELRRWEQQQEISRLQRFHQEKMAAVGSLAAAIAHEVTNPIAAISGIAQHMIDAEQFSHYPDTETIRGHAELIIKHTERIESIMRQVADLTAPHSPDPELLDLNTLVQATCSFISYDKRFHGIDLVPDLPHGLPAVNAVSDHLTQVLMNLLINAADAMERVKGRKPTIYVSTRAAGGEVMLSVKDNGCGMDPAVLSQAFEESFTTKPAKKGRGIGLFLCKTLIEKGGGRMKLESTPAVGTTARVFVPLLHQQAAAT